jgi:hypothetical protein
MKAKRIKISVSSDFFFQLNSTEINHTSFFKKSCHFVYFFQTI